MEQGKLVVCSTVNDSLLCLRVGNKFRLLLRVYFAIPRLIAINGSLF